MQYTQPKPPSVFVYAPNSPTSASQLVRVQVQAEEQIGVAHISPLIACTPRLFFVQCVRQLGGRTADSDLGGFLTTLRHLAQHKQILLVIHDAERIRDLWPESLWEALPLLAELAQLQGRLCVLYVSLLPYSSFRDTAGRAISAAPIILRLPRLARVDVLTLLAYDVDAGIDAFQTMFPEVALPERSLLYTLHKNVVPLVYDSIKSLVRDEQEIRLTTAAIWCALLSYTNGLGTNLAKLMPSLSELIRDALQTLMLHTVGPTEWICEKHRKSTSEPSHIIPIQWPGRTGFSGMSAFMLIAAFIASYNPPKTDVKYFVRELGNSRKRQRRSKGQSAADAALFELEGEKEIWDRPQFWGPRSFTLERLLSIYHALLADFEQDLNEDALLVANERAARQYNKDQLHLEHVAGEFWSRSATALGQINQLVTQKLLVRMSPAGKLVGLQYRVNISYDQIKPLALAVGFPLDVWLWDRYYGT
ncbi:hypothetical protein MYAM1_002161 [Malassezia yamatoensis]|uniref:Origin recognition complex subunit 5 C-terminal domain-containing protein n=1 Tax=Malassezia yamatoensis TaxID=253288 RepID=A0AAJ6CGJ4_9BASI|nr:hypothetical protein MYAM1_002161 [Malassezia yamatoensis]